MGHTVLRHAEPRNIGDILTACTLEGTGRTGAALRRCCVYALWAETVGKTMTACTHSLHLSGRRLYVELQSAAARSELSMMRSDIVLRINERAGRHVIDDIVLR